MTIMAHFYLGEKISKYDIIALFTSFIGIIIINNPPEVDENNNKIKYTSQDILIGTIFAVSGAIGGAMASITKRIMKSGINYSISPFWFAGGSTFWSPIAHSIYTARKQANGEPILDTISYDLYTIGLIVLMSCCTFIAQLAESRAYQLIKASQGGIIQYIQVVIAFCWDILFFNVDLKITDYLGGLLIVGVIFIITLLRALGKIE